MRVSGLAAHEARALLAHVLGVRREALIAHPEMALAPEAAGRFAELARRRASGVPIAYLLGVQEFYGHAFAVTTDVLIPRPDTELLVETALRLLAGHPDARVLELGTGSGCVAISIALARPGLRLAATDRSAPALAVARGNALRLGAMVDWIESDWYAAVDGRFDLIVANPPYVASGDPHMADLRYEPPSALTAGGDGLDCLRAIIAGAPPHLQASGALLVEHGYDQGAAVRSLMRECRLSEARTLRDLAGHERASLGRAPAD